MEPPACAVKRKKRRTRKCLDEIRKRSRHNSTSDANSVSENFDKSKKSSKTMDVTQISSHTLHANITSKRLTLNPTMLSKTVKSETITRALLKSKHQEQWTKPVSPESTVTAAVSISSQESAKETPRHPENSISCTATDTDSESLVIANEIEEISFHDDSDRENVSPKSLILFSPISRAIPGAAAPSRDGAGSPPPRAAHRLYAECVRELPVRMLHLANDAGVVTGAAAGVAARMRLATHSAMDGVRSFLRDLYADTLRLETEGNILRDIRAVARSQARPDEAPKTIVENPREYLSMGTVRRWSALRELNGVASATTRAPALTSPPPPPPRELSASPAVPPQLSVIHDTPEYTYYPRKMNQ